MLHKTQMLILLAVVLVLCTLPSREQRRSGVHVSPLCHIFTTIRPPLTPRPLVPCWCVPGPIPKQFPSITR